jgi:hypothetical protein
MVYHQSDDEEESRTDLAYLQEEYSYDFLGLVDDHPSDAEYEEEGDVSSRFSARPY